MTCKHASDDPSCGTGKSVLYHYREQKKDLDKSNLENENFKQKLENLELLETQLKELLSRTPNPENYEILKTEEVSTSITDVPSSKSMQLVMMVQYSSCDQCSFDSKKVMVFSDTSIKDVIHWRRIDPHFSEKKSDDKKIAPPPLARFPADEQGWRDAVKYAKTVSPYLQNQKKI